VRLTGADAADVLRPHPVLPPATDAGDDAHAVAPSIGLDLTPDAEAVAVAIAAVRAPRPPAFGCGVSVGAGAGRLRDRHLDLAPLSAPAPRAGVSALASAWSLPDAAPAAVLDLPVHGVRYDRCFICLEHGHCAAVSCCNMPRHTRCEKRNLARTVDKIALRPDGLLSLPCSSCRQEWRAVSIDDPFVRTLVGKLAAAAGGAAEAGDAADADLEEPGGAQLAASARASAQRAAPLTLAALLHEAFAGTPRRLRNVALLMLVGGALGLAISFTIRDGAAPLLTGGGGASTAAVGVLLACTCAGVAVAAVAAVARAAIRLRVRSEVAELAAVVLGDTGMTASGQLPRWAAELVVARLRRAGRR
jgi:hypothetical protein